uniref:Docking protein 4 n=1 Tax=Nothobranchius korthausae TaxID=1143690 RepID=A0A1A8F369_9TELE
MDAMLLASPLKLDGCVTAVKASTLSRPGRESSCTRGSTLPRWPLLSSTNRFCWRWSEAVGCFPKVQNLAPTHARPQPFYQGLHTGTTSLGTRPVWILALETLQRTSYCPYTCQLNVTPHWPQLTHTHTPDTLHNAALLILNTHTLSSHQLDLQVLDFLCCL